MTKNKQVRMEVRKDGAIIQRFIDHWEEGAKRRDGKENPKLPVPVLFSGEKFERVIGDHIPLIVQTLDCLTCEKCSGPDAEVDVCPFRSDIDDDHTECACCADCRYNCAEDV